MRILPLSLFMALLAACGTSNGYARPAASQASYQSGGSYAYRGSLEQRVAELERNLYYLAARLCQVENRLGSVVFRFPPNGGVIMERSGQAPRTC